MTASGIHDWDDLFMSPHHRARKPVEQEWSSDIIADLLASLHPEWHSRAACHGMTDEMYPTYADRGGDDARKVCAGCPVRAECREQAYASKERYGFWGGTSARSRQRDFARASRERRAA